MIKLIIEISQEKTKEVNVHLRGDSNEPTKGEVLVLQQIKNNLNNLELEGISNDE